MRIENDSIETYLHGGFAAVEVLPRRVSNRPGFIYFLLFQQYSGNYPGQPTGIHKGNDKLRGPVARLSYRSGLIYPLNVNGGGGD